MKNRWTTKEKVNFMKDESKTRKIIFWCIIIVAIITRIAMWPNAFNEVNCDEAMTAINAKAIADTGKDIYGTSFPVYFNAWQYTGQSAMLTYIMAICIQLFGASTISVRLPLLIISIISLFVMYDFCKRIFKNSNISLVILALLAICPWHIMQSKWSLDCNLFPHFMLMSVYLLYIGLSNKKILYISMLMFALTMYTYGLSIYVVPLFLIALAVYLIINKKVTVKDLIICILIYIAVSMPIILMYIVNFFRLEDIQIGPITIQYFKNAVRTNDMLLFSNNILQTLVHNINNLIKIIFIQYDKLPWNGIEEFGTIYSFSLIFFIIGLIYLIKKNSDFNNTSSYIIKIWLIASIILGLNISDVNINRLNIIWYPMLILTGYGIYKVCASVKNDKKIIYMIALIYCILFISFNYKYYTNHINIIETSFCWSNGIKTAIEYSIDSDKQKIEIDKDALKNGAVPIYVRYVSEFYNNKTKDYSYTEITNIEEDVAYIIKEENLTKDFEEYEQVKFFEYIVVLKNKENTWKQ